jgi:CRP-like cAMP-binding protein
MKFSNQVIKSKIEVFSGHSLTLILFPGDIIIKEGTIGSKMYFIQEGIVDIVMANGEVRKATVGSESVISIVFFTGCNIPIGRVLFW